MKKIFFSLLALFATMGVNAQDKIYFDDVAIPQNGSAVLVVNLKSAENLYGGVECKFQLPEGVTATALTKADRVAELGDAYTLQMAKQSDGYKILGYNSSRLEIPGEDGPIAYITVTADATAKSGEGSVWGITMTTVALEEHTSADATFNVTITDKWVLDETSPVEPAASDGEVSILVKRTLKANQWSTICLPFDMTEAQVKEAFGSDVKLAYFDKEGKNAVSVTGNPVESIEVEFTSYDFSTNEGTLWGCTPYLIYVTQAISEFETNAEIYIDEQYLSQAYTVGRGANAKTYGFYGKLAAGTVIPENGLFLSGNEFWYSTGKTKMKGFRGYFQFTDVVPQSSSAKVNFSVDGEPTSIDGMNIKYAIDGVYDLSGRKIKLENGDVTKLQKGVYIIDGKKVTIK